MAFSFDRPTRLRMRRVFRRHQKQVEAATQQAGEQVETNFIARLAQLIQVRRFIAGWLALVVLITLCTVIQTMSLSSYYQMLRPVPGGAYNEGMVGTYSNANPIYASGSVDTSVSRLIFAGLMKYNDHNVLVGDLASNYSVDTTGRHYTVTLKPNLTWQDGAALTAADVAYTYHMIQNPDAHSSLETSWQGVTVTALSQLTVQFDLPNPLTAFPYSLTTGIIPEHILGTIPADQLRSSTFNTLHPVGAGPFAWQTIQTGDSTDPSKATTFIALVPFNNYTGGKPKLDSFVVRAYPNDESLLAAYKSRDINAMAGLQKTPADIKNHNDYIALNFPSTSALMTFFKTSSGVLADTTVRQALVKAANTADIINGLSYQPRAVQEPLLAGQLAYDPRYKQSGYDPVAANAALDAAGWVKGSDGFRNKAGQPLKFQFYSDNSAESTYVTKKLVADWRKIGVNAIATAQTTADFQATLEYHTYDALLYSISIGVDPDVFAYWDSSQADIRANSRLNFSEYKSAAADSALEAGRTRADPILRSVKYKPFLQAWQSDAPALGLYQPRLLYITRSPVYGLTEHTLNIDTDRYNSVQDWQIHTALVTN